MSCLRFAAELFDGALPCVYFHWLLRLRDDGIWRWDVHLYTGCDNNKYLNIWASKYVMVVRYNNLSTYWYEKIVYIFIQRFVAVPTPSSGLATMYGKYMVYRLNKNVIFASTVFVNCHSWWFSFYFALKMVRASERNVGSRNKHFLAP